MRLGPNLLRFLRFQVAAGPPSVEFSTSCTRMRIAPLVYCNGATSHSLSYFVIISFRTESRCKQICRSSALRCGTYMCQPQQHIHGNSLLDTKAGDLVIFIEIGGQVRVSLLGLQCPACTNCGEEKPCLVREKC
jgi:hypothetical protein